MNKHKTTLIMLATLCALTGILTLASAPAFASADHVFTKAFGGQGSGTGQLNQPAGVAVNEATGDVYVADKGNNRIEVFSAAGQYEGEFDGSGTFEVKGKIETGPVPPTGKLVSPESIAIDNDPKSPSYGDVYVAYLANGIGAIDKFNSTGRYINQITETPAFTFITLSNVQCTTPMSLLGGPISRECPGDVRHFNVIGLAVATDAEGQLWVEQQAESYVTNIITYTDASSNTGVSGTRINTAGSGFAIAGSEVFYINGFGAQKVKVSSVEEYLLSDGVDVGSVSGIAVAQSTGSVFVDYGDAVALFNSAGVFSERFGMEQLTSGSGVAFNESTSAVYVANSSSGVVDAYEVVASAPTVEEEVVAKVSAHDATVSAQINSHGLPTTYMVEYGTSEAYGSTSQAASVAGSFAGNVSVSPTFEGLLQPETTYHFRIVVANGDDTAHSADMTFTTFSDFLGLPDGRGYELVSPLDSADGNVYIPDDGASLSVESSPLPMRASADGDAVEYVADPLATGGNGQVGGGFGNEYVASRDGSGGWSTVNMGTPGLDKVPFEALFSSELSNSGTADVPAGARNFSGEGEGGGRSPLVSVLPDGKIVSKAVLGSLGSVVDTHTGELNDLSHVLSADGSRVFWTDLEAGADMEHVFVRVDNDRTVAVSVGAATFWTASTDGRYAFYTENERLWRFDVEDGSREEIAGENGGVLGVIGTGETGEDGAYVYFVAQGVLAPGATQGNCSYIKQAGAGACNLYVRHDGVTSFIASLSGRDDDLLVGGVRLEGAVAHSNIFDGDWRFGLGDRTAEVARDGHSVVFTSVAKITGYENNGVPEVYVYDADNGVVSCVSCNPTGLRATTGGYVQPSYSPLFMRRWVSEDGSRVFFDSREGLVAQDTNELQDVYEWEREGTGDCRVRVPVRQDGGCTFLLSGGSSSDDSYFLDASANGNDVFMITRARLVPQDLGETYEVYDARVGAVLPPVEPVCTGTGCQGLPAGPPVFATPSSVTFNGVGNFAVPTPVLVPSVKAKSVKCVKPRRLSRGKCVKTKGKAKSVGKRARKSSRYGRTK
jgi:hypothetical protein